MSIVWAFVLVLVGSASALDWQNHTEFRLSLVSPVGTGQVGFTRMPAVDLGVTFTNRVRDERTLTNRNLLSGSGLALGDVNGDGRCDVFFCGLDIAPQLYLNQGQWRFTNVTAAAFPGGEFEGAGAGFDATGATLADVDGDGDLDLLVNGLGRGTRLWLNDGHGLFTEATDAAGLRSSSGATSLALADVDKDGDLDIYVCNFRPTTVLDQPTTQFTIRNQKGVPVVISVDGRPTTAPDLLHRFEVASGGNVLEFGEPDVLWLNDGKGHFTAASWTDGTFLDEDGKPLQSAPRDWGLAAHLGDVNDDGRPDLYVCNDLHTPDRFWLNVSTPGHTQFRAIARTALRNNSTFSMGVDFGDLNRDGFVDLFTVDMWARDRSLRARQLAGLSPQFRRPGELEDRVQLTRNALQLNRGDTTFAETAIYSGIEASDWSWGPIFLDVDLDGYEDVLIGNGQLRDFQDSDGAERIAAAHAGGRTLTATDIAQIIRELPKFATPNALFRNRTGELRRVATEKRSPRVEVPIFVDVASEWGFATPGISQGAALADLDNDGDLDVVMNNLQDAPGFYRNNSAAPRLAVQLRSQGKNSHGVGAKITARIANSGARFPREQFQHVISGSRYLSGDEGLRTFATGNSRHVDLEVRWPSGRVSVLPQLPPDAIVEVLESSALGTPPAPASKPAPRLEFADVSTRLNHTHTDEDFDDFARQPLLPHKLSQLGPGVGWADLNGDGFDDLVIGTGRSGQLAAFLNDGQGGFRRSDAPPFNRPVSRDQTTILPFGSTLLVGSANWEDGQTNGGALRLYDASSQRSGEAVLGVNFSVGPLTAADLDGDGTLEIFVGGRAVPGRWPEAPPSLLLKSTDGKLGVVQRFETLGRVSGACFSDLDGDGHPDLLLATEWGPLQILRNDGGKLFEYQTMVEFGGRRISLNQLLGFWNSVTSGDFDGDGRLDFVAGNWGLNNSMIAALPPDRRPSLVGINSPLIPLRSLYFGDTSGTGGIDVIEAIPGMGVEWPARELVAWALAFPWLRTEIPTYAAFSQANLTQIFGQKLASTKRLELNWLASTLFLNRGDHFEIRELPDWAQLAPVFGLAVADADGDGAEDLFLAQNWFATDPLSARNDAGRGLWLLGDGRGNFTAETLSGVAAYGEQRAAAIADFDTDGRPDLVVTQNGAATKLFRNTGARPGLRVRLRGQAPNDSAIGAAVRLRWGERAGPWRELHLGAGYWSADSPTIVLGQPTPATTLEVRWPNGKLTQLALPTPTAEVVVNPDGTRSANP